MYKEYLYLPLYKSEFEHMQYIACFCVIQGGQYVFWIYKANQYTDSIHFNIFQKNIYLIIFIKDDLKYLYEANNCHSHCQSIKSFYTYSYNIVFPYIFKYSLWSIQTDKANLVLLSAVTQTLNSQMHKSKIPTQNLQLWI